MFLRSEVFCLKRIICLSLLLLLLTGCSEWIKDSQLSVTPHVEHAPIETLPSEEPPIVSNRNGLRGEVIKLIRNWTEQGTILIRNYEGNLSEDLSETLTYATKEEPIGAYAVDYADWMLTGDEAYGTVAVSIVFRRSAAEIDSIVTVNGNDATMQKVRQALKSYATALTLRIRNYQEMDFVEAIRIYCMENPDSVLALPEVSAELYPKEGKTRILELHFDYPYPRDQMTTMMNSVSTLLSSADSYARKGSTELEKATLAYRFLTTRFDYTIVDTAPVMPAYELLSEGKAHSLSFACVFRSICDAAGVQCSIVTGMREEQPCYWNQLCIDGNYYYTDIYVLREETELRLLTTEEMLAEGYVWDTAAYPPTPIPNAEDVPEPTEDIASGDNALADTESDVSYDADHTHSADSLPTDVPTSVTVP